MAGGGVGDDFAAWRGKSDEPFCATALVRFAWRVLAVGGCGVLGCGVSSLLGGGAFLWLALLMSLTRLGLRPGRLSVGLASGVGCVGPGVLSR